MENNMPADSPKEQPGGFLPGRQTGTFGGKKIIALVIFLAVAVAVFDRYNKHVEKLSFNGKNLTGTGTVATTLEEKKEVSTPGGLRTVFDSKTAYLTRVGTINQTNVQREKNGLPALTENQELNRAALAKVKDMFAVQYFDHVSPIGKGPSHLAEEADYEYIAVGENLALGNFTNDEELVEAWMNSPGHKANILNGKYTEIGVAVLKGTFEGRTTWLAVQEFGRPKSSCPAVNAFLKNQINIYKDEINSLKTQIDSLKNYLDSTEPENQHEVDEYNKKVAEFNNLVKSYNNKVDWLKNMTGEYNLQVSAYNSCVGS